MIYVLISKKTDNKLLQNNIISFIKETIRDNKIRYKIKFMESNILEKNLYQLKENDIILWDPILASTNIDLVKNYKYSIVILQHRTLLLQKISKVNPINENVAITNGFYVIYIDEEFNDITNNEWKLIIQEKSYVIKKEKLLELIRENPLNIIKNNIDIQQKINKDKINKNVKQINLS